MHEKDSITFFSACKFSTPQREIADYGRWRNEMKQIYKNLFSSPLESFAILSKVQNENEKKIAKNAEQREIFIHKLMIALISMTNVKIECFFIISQQLKIELHAYNLAWDRKSKIVEYWMSWSQSEMMGTLRCRKLALIFSN